MSEVGREAGQKAEEEAGAGGRQGRRWRGRLGWRGEERGKQEPLAEGEGRAAVGGEGLKQEAVRAAGGTKA